MTEQTHLRIILTIVFQRNLVLEMSTGRRLKMVKSSMNKEQMVTMTLSQDPSLFLHISLPSVLNLVDHNTVELISIH